MDATIELSSAAGTNAQTICGNSAITAITYNIGGGATGAYTVGLPDGVTGNLSGETFTISGMPEVYGTFPYTVTTSGAVSPCTNATATGTITVFGYSGGEGSEGNPFQIANLADLKFLSENDCHWNKHFMQTADIDASATSNWNGGEGFRPIGYRKDITFDKYFTGSYDGQGYTISGLTIKWLTPPDSHGLGMFGYTIGAKLKRISLLNVDIYTWSGSNSVGGLVGNAEGYTEIIQSYATGKVVGNSFIGGLVGQMISNSSVSESYATCEVSEYMSEAYSECMGGLVGYSQDNTSISNSYATGPVNGDEFIGGLVGLNYNTSTISKCYSTGLVQGTANTGGLVGYNFISPPYSGVILNSFWDTETSGTFISAGGTGKTTAEMKTESTFAAAGWSFNPTWAMAACPDWSYPYLAGNPQVPAPGLETTNNPINGGEIAANKDTFMPGETIEFTSESAPTDHIGILEYQWQMNNGVEWVDIEDEVSETYTFDGTLTQTTSFRRLAKVHCASVWVASNTVEIAIGSAPTIIVTPSELTDFNYVFGEGPSAQQSFTVSGTNLTNNVIITPSENFEILVFSGYENDEPIYSPTLKCTMHPSYLTDPISSKIYVRMKTGLSVGTYTGELINITSEGAESKTVTCSGEVTAPPPTITVAPATLSDFTYVEGSGPSQIKSFVVTGQNLTATVEVKPSDKFKVDFHDGVNFDPPLYGVGIAPQDLNEGQSKTIYVRMVAGLEVGNYIEDIEITSTGAETKKVTCSGIVTTPPPTITVTPTTLSGFTYVAGSGPSQVISFKVGGSNLTDWLVIDPPTNYEISSIYNELDPFEPVDAIEIQPEILNPGDQQTIYVRLKAGLTAGNYNNEEITISSTGAATKTVTCSGNVIAPPTLTVAPTSLSEFTYVEGSGPSDIQSFNVGAENLTYNLIISSSTTHFEISASYSPFVPEDVIQIAPDIMNAATLKTFFVRLKAGLIVGNYNTVINITSEGAESKTVTCSGVVTAPPSIPNEVIFNSSGTFTVPENVYWINVQLWGGGGSGGTASQQLGAGGAGGGAYSSSTLSVTPGESYTVQVGQGGEFLQDGGDSWFASATTVMAKGGKFGSTNSTSAGKGGSADSGYGDIKYSGGDGAVGTSTSSGGGGSSAGEYVAGTNAIGYLGAIAPVGGGNGGDGNTGASGDGHNGFSPGGGGGGALMAGYETGYYSGGIGANGIVIISWEAGCSTPPPVAEAQSFCNGDNSPTVNDLVVTALAGAIVNWYDVAAGGSPLAGSTTLKTGIYYVSQTLNDCESVRREVPVTLYDTPSAPSAGSNSPVCEGSVLNLTTTTIENATYSWTGPNGFTSSDQNPSIVDVTTAAGGTYSVTATVNGCTSAAGSVAVTVNAIPSVTSAGSNSPICEGSVLNLTATFIAGATYSWTGPNGFISSEQNPSIIDATVDAAGTYSVTATVNGCTSALAYTSVAVNTIPAAASSPNPNDGAVNICYEGDEAITSITWAMAEDVSSCDVYFGEGSLPSEVAANVATNSWNTGILSANKTYYWKVVPKNDCGSVISATTWTFTTTDMPCCTYPTLGGASLASSNVCNGAGAQVNLTGLLPFKTFTLEYSIDGVGQTPVTELASDASGNASFTTRNLTSDDHQKTLLITGLTDNETGCSKAFSRSLTLNVVPLPTATLDNLTTTICQGETVTLTGSVTATGNWSLSITGGGGVSVLGSGSGTFEKTITPPVLTTTYSIMSILYNDYRCTSYTGFTGQAVVTADQKPILVVHNPEPVVAPNTVDLTAPEVTEGSSFPQGTVLQYWKGEVQLTNEQAQVISESGIYTIRAIRGACDVPADVEVTINSIAENTPPVLVTIGDKTVNELATLSFTASATDGDLPANTLTFSLANPASGMYPTGAEITTGGDFSWTPTEAQGPGTYRVKVVVSDGTATDEEEIQITVIEVNIAPELTGVPTEATIPEGVTYDFDANALDVDIPAQTLTFSLVGAPAGASINGATGVFAWNPAEAQGPDDYTFTVRVSDGVVNTDQSITLHVTEVNVSPELTGVPAEATIDEGVTYSFDADASDVDIPAQTLTFSLVGAPSGASINGATGVFVWNPAEAQGPDDYTFTVRVSDGVVNTDQSITLHVTEVNVSPELTGVPAEATIDEGATYSFDADALDVDIPAQTLTFSLVGAPAGASINGTTGVFVWNPTEAQGPDDYTFTVRVSDGVVNTDQSITLHVTEVNVAPELTGVPAEATIDEGVTYSFDADASDVDIPAQTLTFSLVGAPSGASINGATGVFVWNPAEAQGPDDYTFTVRVSDGVVNTDQSITLHVTEVNVSPELTGVPAEATIDEGATYSFDADASDVDIPAQTLTFSLVGAPAGASINGATGVFAWNPAEAQGPDDYTFTVRVSDGVVNTDQSITLHVTEVNVSPELTGVPAEATIDEGVTYSFDADALDVDIPAQTLTFSLVGAPAGASINGTTGVFVWNPAEAQGPDDYTFTVRVSDGVVNTDQSITLHVTEVNVAPELTGVPAEATIDEGVTYSFDADASDVDIPAQTLTFSLVGAPSGASINGATGVFVWNPAEAQGPDDYTFTVRVSDGVVNTDQSITLHVTEVNVSPELTGVPAEATIDEGVTYSFDADASDVDIPAQTLTFSLVGAPAGASINGTTGVFAWNPAEAQGPDDYTFTVRVSDGVVNTDQSITLHVTEVNVSPELTGVPAEATIDEGVTYSFDADASDVDIPAQTLTFSLVGAPAGASINGTTGVFAWNPAEAQGPDDYTFTVRVSDGVVNTDQSITLHVTEVNIAPELTGVPTEVIIPWGNLLTFTATASDQDIPENTLTFSLIGAPTGASINGTTGVFEWTPVETQSNQSYTFKIRVTDNGINPANLYDEEEITVTVVKRKTLLVYGGDVTEQYSDETNLSATLYDITNGVPGKVISGKPIDFTIQSQSTDPDSITNESGIASAKLVLTQSPVLLYKVVSTFAGDASYEASSDEDDFNITHEDALIDYIGTEIVGEANQDVNTTPVTLRATITDNYIDDVNRGDIRNARVRFEINGSPISGWLEPTLVNPADLTQGIVSYVWNAPVPSSGYATYDITVNVGDNGYYQGSLDDVPVTVYRTSLNEFISGGGHIIPVDSKGEYASDPGRKVNFGFNVKWNKTMKNLQGNFNLILRRGSEIYQIKSNALSGLGIDGSNPCSHKAVFSSKANLNRVTGGITENLMGNLSLQVTLTDNGKPGVTDMIGVTLYNGSTLLYSSSWPISSTEELTLVGGNILVNDGIICNASDITYTVITSGKNPSLTGENVKFIATVYGQDATPQGTLVFTINGETFAGTLDSKGSASVEYHFDEAGTYEVEASYNSANGYKPSTGTITQLVNGTSFVLTSSKNPSVSGDEVTFTAVLTSPGAAPAGTVTFKVDDEEKATDVPLADNKATFTTNLLSSGTHTIEAAYTSTNDPLLVADPATLMQVVNNVSISLASTKNPSVVTETVQFTATVTGSASIGKTVTFFKDGSDIGTATVDVSGNATVSHAIGTAGTYVISAECSGKSVTLNQVVTNPVITLVSSLNPSAENENVTFTATVTGASEGTVRFTNGQGEYSTFLNDGKATWTIPLTEGSYLIKAEYYILGNLINETSLTQVVTAENISVELVSSKPLSVVYGTNITFTATVKGSVAAPSGTITFKDGTTVLKNVLVSGGKASFSTNKLPVGYHPITATYNLTGTISDTIKQTVTAKVKSAEIGSEIEPEVGLADLKVYPNPFSEKLNFEFVSPVDDHVQDTGIRCNRPHGKYGFR
jgi:hypothetical protein